MKYECKPCNRKFEVKYYSVQPTCSDSCYAVLEKYSSIELFNKEHENFEEILKQVIESQVIEPIKKEPENRANFFDCRMCYTLFPIDSSSDTPSCSDFCYERLISFEYPEVVNTEYNRFYEAVDNVILISEPLKRDVMPKGPIDVIKCHVCRNEVDYNNSDNRVMHFCSEKCVDKWLVKDNSESDWEFSTR